MMTSKTSPVFIITTIMSVRQFYRWHYTCTNLHQLIASSINSNDSSFEVTEIGFYSDPNEVGYQIDEVSLSSDQRSIESVSSDPNTLD